MINRTFLFIYLVTVEVDGDEFQNIEIPSETSNDLNPIQSDSLNSTNEVSIFHIIKKHCYYCNYLIRKI
jgi:thioredoxin-related protein